ncbi:MAG: cob(I)yrinic acid a,c-diamide adenosyltransferase [Planctomycetes bacterium]|nr:cob(I)yrinic acid a,c-diamide adenosyltransferase [Planctomycetota bacterium]NUQ34411.1 cob(I)yrinic acid a,c-diamide adenosyltransferase [Planctomycetaceae bacterium]
MKLYTKGGDKGETGLFGGARVSKADLRVRAYGEVDELNSVLGLVRAKSEWKELNAELERIQSELFNVGALLASTPEGVAKLKMPRVGEKEAARLEKEIDRSSAAVPALSNFVLPGGAELAAWLHFARCVCRRAEREVVALGEHSPVDAGAIIYLNRLSDLLFAWAREANVRASVSEILWKGT